MNKLKPLFAVLAATGWISISEFIRNTFLVHSYWSSHYTNLGYVFPEEAVNGALWAIWSILYAVSIFMISRKNTMISTFIVSWIMGFAMMWVVIGNLGVLPFGILPLAIPLSLLEAFIAVILILKISPPVTD